MLHARLNHAPVTLLPRDVSQPVFAASDLAHLDPGSFLPVPLRLHFRLTLALSRAVMHSPQLISIFVRLLLDTCLANRAYYDIKLVPIAPHSAPVIVWPSMVATRHCKTFDGRAWLLWKYMAVCGANAVVRVASVNPC